MTDPLFAYCRLWSAGLASGLKSGLAAALTPESAPLNSLLAGPARSPIQPLMILVLCVLAGLSTAVLLPGKREAAVRRLGGAGLLAAGLVLAGVLVRWTIDLGGMSVYFWAFSAIALFASVRVITHTKPVYSALYFVLTVFATAGLFVLMWAEFMAAAIVLIYAGAILITYVFVIMLASEASSVGVTEPGKNPLAEHDGVSRSPLAAAIVGFATAGLLLFLILDKSADIDHNRADAAAGGVGQLDEASNGATADAVTNPWPDEPSHGLNLKKSYEAANAQRATHDRIAAMGSTQALGQELIENHAINLQLAAVILTLAMVGAITLARRRVGGLVTHHGGPGAGPEVVHTPNTPVDDNPHSIAVYGTNNPRQKAYPEN